MLVLCLGRCLLPKPALPQVLHLVSRIFVIEICSNSIPPLTSCGCRESKTHTRTCHCPSLCVQVPNSDYCNLPCGQNLLFISPVNWPVLIPFWFFTFPTGIQTSLIVASIYLARPFLFRSGYFSAGDRAHCCSTALFAALARQKVAGKLHWNSESDSPTEVLRNRCKMMQSCKIKLTQSRKLKSLRAVPRCAKSSRELSSLGTH